MLKADVLSAVIAAREAIQDLVTEVSVTTRTVNPHMPGQPTTYTEVVKTMKLAVVEYTDREIDGERVRATDMKGILFPMDGFVSVNDTIAFNGQSLRVLNNKPTMVGEAVAVNTLQMRPT